MVFKVKAKYLVCIGDDTRAVVIKSRKERAVTLFVRNHLNQLIWEAANPRQHKIDPPEVARCAQITLYSIVTLDHAKYAGFPSLLIQRAVVSRSNAAGLVGSTCSSVSSAFEVTQISSEI